MRSSDYYEPTTPISTWTNSLSTTLSSGLYTYTRENEGHVQRVERRCNLALGYARRRCLWYLSRSVRRYLPNLQISW